MFRKSIFILTAGIFLCLGLWFNLRAQTTIEQNINIPEKLARLESKIDKLSADMDIKNREILKQLDQVLSNQQTILKELSIVKVRASIKH